MGTMLDKISHVVSYTGTLIFNGLGLVFSVLVLSVGCFFLVAEEAVLLGWALVVAGAWGVFIVFGWAPWPDVLLHAVFQVGRDVLQALVMWLSPNVQIILAALSALSFFVVVFLLFAGGIKTYTRIWYGIGALITGALACALANVNFLMRSLTPTGYFPRNPLSIYGYLVVGIVILVFAPALWSHLQVSYKKVLAGIRKRQAQRMGQFLEEKRQQKRRLEDAEMNASYARDFVVKVLNQLDKAITELNTLADGDVNNFRRVCVQIHEQINLLRNNVHVKQLPEGARAICAENLKINLKYLEKMSDRHRRGGNEKLSAEIERAISKIEVFIEGLGA